MVVKLNLNRMWLCLNKAAELLIIDKSPGRHMRKDSNEEKKKKKKKGPHFDLLERPGNWDTRSWPSPFCTSIIPLRPSKCVPHSRPVLRRVQRVDGMRNLQANYPWPGWIWRTCQASSDWSSDWLSRPGLVRTVREVDRPLRWASQTSTPRQECQQASLLGCRWKCLQRGPSVVCGYLLCLSFVERWCWWGEWRGISSFSKAASQAWE